MRPGVENHPLTHMGTGIVHQMISFAEATPPIISRFILTEAVEIAGSKAHEHKGGPIGDQWTLVHKRAERQLQLQSSKGSRRSRGQDIEQTIR